MQSKKIKTFVLLAIIGNCLVMIGEYFFISDKNLVNGLMNEMAHNINIDARTNMSKFWIWLVAMFGVAMCNYLLNLKFGADAKHLLACFYICSFEVNLNIVSHPMWMKVALIPIVLLPFILVPSMLSLVKTVIKTGKIIDIGSNTDRGYSYNH